MPALFANSMQLANATSLWWHLDARTKLAITVSCAVLSVACSGFVAQMVLFLSTLIYALLLRRPILLIVVYAAMALMIAIATLCAIGMGYFLPKIGGVSMKSLVIPFLRALTMMNVVLVLALTTRVEHLLITLERLRLPFCVFLPTAVMLRFIPTFTKDIQQVWETLKIKGYPLGIKMLTLRPFLSARLVLIPILFRALKTSESLGVAAELKGLGYFDCPIRQDFKTLTSLDARLWALLILIAIATIFSEVFFKNLFVLSGVAMP